MGDVTGNCPSFASVGVIKWAIDTFMPFKSPGWHLSIRGKHGQVLIDHVVTNNFLNRAINFRILRNSAETIGK